MLRSRSPPCWSCRSFFNLPSSSAATPFEGTKIVTSGEAYSPPQQPRRRPRAGRLFFESSSRSIFLFEHDLFGKPVPTHRVVARGHAFPDHALCGVAQPREEGIDALEQRGGVLAEFAGGDQDVIGEGARLVGGLAGASDIARNFAGAGGDLLHASRNLARRRALFFDSRS